MRLNRTQKTIRNLLISALLLAAAWVSLGFPPYTVGGMCRRVARERLLEDLEPLYVLREAYHYSSDWYNTHFTYVLARAGDEYIEFQYERDLLKNQTYAPRGGEIAKGTLCTGREGTMYVAGDFPTETASAAAEIVLKEGEGESAPVTHRLTGELLTEDVLGFWYADDMFSNFPPFQEEKDLVDLVWDYHSREHGGGRGLLHAELPCTVTLFNETGEPLEVLELTIGTYDIASHR